MAGKRTQGNGPDDAAAQEPVPTQEPPKLGQGDADEERRATQEKVRQADRDAMAPEATQPVGEQPEARKTGTLDDGSRFVAAEDRANPVDSGPAGDAGLDVSGSVAAVAENKAWEDSVGYRGVRVDPTPLHAYTVEGVTSEEPTPETDEGARLAALERRNTPGEQLDDLDAETRKEAMKSASAADAGDRSGE